MEQSRSQPATQFQARAAQLLKKLNWRPRLGGRHSKDNMSIISTGTNNGRSNIVSPDVPCKPDMSSPLAGFRLDEASNPTDTDDSSSSNSPSRQSRRYSAWEALTQSSVSPVFAAHGPAALFLRETTASQQNTSVQPSCDKVNVLAPAPLFLWTGASTDCLTRAANDGLLHSTAPNNMPDVAVLQDTSLVPDETTQLDRSQTPRQMEGLDPSNEPITTIDTPNLLLEPESAQTALSVSLTVPPIPSSSIQGRRSPETRLTTTLPPPFRVATERGLRLSPSIISRHQTAVRPVVRLQHVPSLTVNGRPDVDQEPDSAVEYEDDDDGDDDNDNDNDNDDDGDGDGDEGLKNENWEHQSDEDGDREEMRSSSTGRSLSHSPLREFQTRVIDLAPTPDAGPSSRPFASSSSAGEATPTLYNAVDFFSSKTYGKLVDSTPSQDASTPKPFSPKTPLAESINVRRRITPIPSLEHHRAQPSLNVSRAPSLYRAPSHSMIDLSVSRRDLRLKRKKSCDTVRSNVPSVSGNTVETTESDHTDKIIGKLLRRTSMPTFTSTSDPPPYPSFDPRPPRSAPVIQSREDEGRERLPPYSNSLYLTAIMPCKMEFSSPGIQAKDRKWRRVFCELEGTTLRVYKCPPGASGAGIIGEWWERRVGVGDLTSGYHALVRKPDEGPAPSSKIDQSVASSSSPPLTPHRPRSESQSSRATNQSATPSTRANRRLSGASFLASWRNGGSSSVPQLRGRGMPSSGQSGTNGGMELLPVSEPNSRRNSVSSSNSQETTPQRSSTPTPRALSRLSFLSSKMQLRNGEIQKPGKGDLIRAYTLQHAESGLGNDYLKRKNVIRVRLEGEQFLLQASDVSSVVEWIEVSSMLRGGGSMIDRARRVSMRVRTSHSTSTIVSCPKGQCSRGVDGEGIDDHKMGTMMMQEHHPLQW
ncbi:uncharacterized protein EDB91DRAFT_539140 [Suillus paluster]|uniref:uncharacterized protein n=1 Tax=Suillus paluster TaxID=48578 RepID=UPI001B87C490|nr:uncharacterized protein EDB91DRAFT_539140 [Suillus paluster]KAG1736135.1 hypothetical protein EDB91DRAFT_539140 [Suillus paluster]